MYQPPPPKVDRALSKEQLAENLQEAINLLHGLVSHIGQFTAQDVWSNPILAPLVAQATEAHKRLPRLAEDEIPF